MDATLNALGGILLRAIPTLILLLILNLYLKAVFFKPLQEVLRKRREMTEGAREAAEASFKKATERTAEYEAKLREARAAIYREQEEIRRGWLDDQARQLGETREQMHKATQAARQEMDLEIARSKQELRTYSEALAEQIASSLLRRRAS